MSNFRTHQEALEDALKGFLYYFKPELDEDSFVLDEDW